MRVKRTEDVWYNFKREIEKLVQNNKDSDNQNAGKIPYRDDLST